MAGLLIEDLPIDRLRRANIAGSAQIFRPGEKLRGPPGGFPAGFNRRFT